MWLASTVSNLGTWLQMTAGPWVMQELTGSPLMVSLVMTALFLPRLLMTLPGGALADVMDRRTVIVGGLVVSAVPVAGLAVMTWNGTITPWSLLVLSFLTGFGNAVRLPAFQTLVPDLVPREMLAQAVTLNSAAFNMARAIGPSIGGALVAVGLTHVAFGANAVSYLAVIGVLLTLPSAGAKDRGARRRIWRSTMLGLRYVRFTRSLRVLVVLAALFQICAASVQALLPNLASVELGLDASGFGILYGLFGVGALVGAGTRERVRFRVGRAMLPVTIVAFGLSGVVLGTVTNAWLAGAALMVGGATWVWTNTTINASVQTLAPQWVRGRVVSIYLLTIGLQPIGAFTSGVIAELTRSGVAIAVMGIATVVLGIASIRLEVPSLDDIEEPAPPPEDWAVPLHADDVGGGRILVATTWHVDPGRIDAFLDCMRELRRQRLRTGASRWTLYRAAEDPHVLTETFEVSDWQEHLAQHARIDGESAEVIRRARAFDVRGEPESRHLAGVDVSRSAVTPLEAAQLMEHAERHRTDGSVPLDDR